ncbi:hypothetical protein SAMN02745945_01102 [Peptoclostridium litorale DSM 5388]|uniref:Uncharacterized protein n=1 Tax=Peptoclostridium litorale DSM 5388 TaxID=1121324 RepID=A0A069RMA1_PEPLI|nr:hypothetical protein [Peptoclostridium litorale]KDR93905.1 hypothetical protein CLIT_23c01770 [Peptoclostridium litorale DSM 5388]KDR95332.1 hypothetical protein CLIT_10c00590 [Peptoclostridium litorale DSM 5388]SIN88283.1 hypothetical protein SAMN02745945_01102 [Peptoclostridium litorale DSM 5388]
MKIKLNITKDLKRDLKTLAAGNGMERSAFINEVIDDLIQRKEAVWISKIDAILKTASEDAVSLEDKAKSAMKKTTKKLQPMIINVDERTYIALAIIAKKSKTSKEEMLVNLLTDLVNDSK